MTETYKLIGEVWGLSSHPPQLGHLAVLLEGIGYFPRNEGLIRQAIDLYARFGLESQAEALAQMKAQRDGSIEQRVRLNQGHSDRMGLPAVTSAQ